MLVALPTEVITPVRFAFVAVFPAVNPSAVPVQLVRTPELGVPRFGDDKAGDDDPTNNPLPVWPDKSTLTELFVLINNPYAVVKFPLDLSTTQVRFAVTHNKES